MDKMNRIQGLKTYRVHRVPPFNTCSASSCQTFLFPASYSRILFVVFARLCYSYPDQVRIQYTPVISMSLQNDVYDVSPPAASSKMFWKE